MKKSKFIRWLLVIILCPFLFVFASFMFLILAPGVEIFGIRYVAVGQGEYELPQSEEFMPNFSGDIYIEAEDIPINIKFDLIHNVHVEYKQVFVGFTRSKNKFPAFSYEVKDNNLHLKSSDLVTFLYSTQDLNSADCYYNVYLPYEMKDRNIFVKSLNGVINFNASGSKKLKNVSFETINKVNITGELNVEELKFSTRESITITENINAEKYILDIGNNDFKIDRDIAGTVDVQSGGATLYMKKANKVVFKSSSGSLKPIKDSEIIVNDCVVETKSGIVEIAQINSDNDNVVKTTSGSIKVGSAGNVIIENLRGNTTVGSVKTANIVGGFGSITVGEVLSKITAETKNGNIFLGEEEKKVNNPTVKSATGKIIVNNGCGNIDLNSENNSVKMFGDAVTKVKINAGEEVEATNLTGKIDITANGLVDVQIIKITDDVTIKTTDGCRNVNVDLKNHILNDFNYSFKSTKARIVNIYSGENLVTEGESEVRRSPLINGLFDVIIETTYSDINVYCK